MSAASASGGSRYGCRHASYLRGFHAALPESTSPTRGTQGSLEVEVVLDLAGTTALALAPIAGATRMTLKGDWPHPSFGGRFLPVVREVRDDGFQAAWQIPSLATTAPDDFARHAVLCAPSAPDTADEAAPRDGPGAQAKRCIETFDVAFIPSSTR